MMARIGIGNQEADRFVAQAFCPPNGSQAFSRTRPTRFQRVAFCRLQACRPSQPRWLTSVWKPKFATARRRRPVAAATAPRGDPLSRVHGLAPDESFQKSLPRRFQTAVPWLCAWWISRRPVASRAKIHPT